MPYKNRKQQLTYLRNYSRRRSVGHFNSDLHVCFDCGAKLSKEKAIIVMGRGGFLVFCFQCTFHRMKIKDTWRKVFH